MPVDHDFVGTGWAFPPQLNASGGIAMVRRERELEEAMRIILLTYPGERPMRPEFGSRVRDFVFRSVDEEMTTALAYEVQHVAAALGAASRRRQGRRRHRIPTSRSSSTSTSSTR